MDKDHTHSFNTSGDHIQVSDVEWWVCMTSNFHSYLANKMNIYMYTYIKQPQQQPPPSKKW